MNHFKTFILGVATALGVYYITRKRENGRSLLDDLLDDPASVVKAAKDMAVDEAIETIKEKIS
ncbi:YtxH domain-containing protein [Mucilaginibacter agri]|uniref:YtxH domain-containing protein n=1 Tax=Mucilaginibacter agri TaxID=2695265 RepID=A0A966DT39_9SPHI|nr:YtxH domain-containing protein [Mucilaginibacter agri]NCD68349.1 YtxH domain-containing protein [Mucilaginibacter agri]